MSNLEFVFIVAAVAGVYTVAVFKLAFASGQVAGRFVEIARRVGNECGACGGLAFESRQVEITPCKTCSGSGQKPPKELAPVIQLVRRGE